MYLYSYHPCILQVSIIIIMGILHSFHFEFFRDEQICISMSIFPSIIYHVIHNSRLEKLHSTCEPSIYMNADTSNLNMRKFSWVLNSEPPLKNAQDPFFTLQNFSLQFRSRVTGLPSQYQHSWWLTGLGRVRVVASLGLGMCTSGSTSLAPLVNPSGADPITSYPWLSLGKQLWHSCWEVSGIAWEEPQGWLPWAQNS